MDLSILKKEVIVNKAKESLKSPTFWARAIGLMIPIFFLVYILYIHFLPFGYQKTLTIDVGSEGDTAISEFYLEPSQALSERRSSQDGTTYRELNGLTNAIFKPKVFLKNPEINIEVVGQGVSVIPPQININPDEVHWDKSWDFSKEVPNDLVNKGVFYFEGNTYFNGKSSMEYASSTNSFESESFSVYSEWVPINSEENFQEIVGHYNWELLQDKNQVRFMVGRMNDKNGQFYSIEYPIKNVQSFFSSPHVAIASYVPDPINGHGYIELYVDGNFAGRTQIGKDTIWKDYNGDKNITLGLSSHGVAKYFKGALKKVSIASKKIISEKNNLSFTAKESHQIDIPIFSVTTTSLYKLELHVRSK